MASAIVNGLRLEYEISSDGSDVVVLAGGSGMPPLVWDLCGLASTLEADSHRVLTYAARGVAPSEAPASPYSVTDLADDLIGLLDHLEIRECQIVGYSLGGFIAEHLALTRPDVIRAAMLLASAGPLSPVLRTIFETATAFIEEFGHLPAAFTRWQEVMTSLPPAALRDDAEQVDLWWQLALAHEEVWTSPNGKLGQWAAAESWARDPDRMAHLDEISIPVLVACFEHDQLFPPRNGMAAATAIPHGRFAELPEAAHSGLVTHPDACNALILDFLHRT